MNKISLFMFLFLVIVTFLFIYLFYIYLYNQYKKATINYYKKKINVKKYFITTKDNYRNSKIKNNVTEIIDHQLINSLVGYAIIEFIDEYGRTIKTQTIFKPSLSIGRDDSNDVVLRNQTVSRFQCLIIFQNNIFFVCNLSANNPTLLNNVAIKNTKKLIFGDTIKIANYTLRFQEILNKPQVG